MFVYVYVYEYDVLYVIYVLYEMIYSTD
jgi:hypothetical protein